MLVGTLLNAIICGAPGSDPVKAGTTMLRYTTATCIRKFKRRFTRCSAGDAEPHFLAILRGLTKEDFESIPFDAIIDVSGYRDIQEEAEVWSQFGHLTGSERSILKNPFDFSSWPPELVVKIVKAMAQLQMIVSNGVRDRNQVINLFWYYHSFVVELLGIFHYHIIQIEAILFPQDRKRNVLPAGDYKEYRTHVNMLSNISEMVARVAWGSPLWRRILIYSNRSLDLSRQKIIIRGKEAGKLGRPPKTRVLADNTIGNKATPCSTLMQEATTSTNAAPEDDDYQSDDDFQEELDAEDQDMEGEDDPDPIQGLRHPVFSNGELAQRIQLWLRICTSHIKAIMEWIALGQANRVRESPVRKATIVRSLQLTMISGPTPAPSTNGPCWRHYLRTQITKREDAADIIYQALSRVGRIKIDGPFTGAVHSETFLKTLEFKANEHKWLWDGGNTNPSPTPARTTPFMPTVPPRAICPRLSGPDITVCSHPLVRRPPGSQDLPTDSLLTSHPALELAYHTTTRRFLGTDAPPMRSPPTGSTGTLPVPANHNSRMEPGLDEVLNALRGINPIIGTSKRCCHVCAAIITALSSAQSKTSTWCLAPVLDAHRTVYPYVLPPLLPRPISQRILGHYRGELRRIVGEIIEVADQETRRQVEVATTTREADALSQTSSRTRSLDSRAYSSEHSDGSGDNGGRRRRALWAKGMMMPIMEEEN